MESQTIVILMAKGVDFFNSMELLEPRCKGCDIKLDWGVNTEFNDEQETQVCKGCGIAVE